jgi:CubicO group peptidase (beta-lactamase class C family)
MKTKWQTIKDYILRGIILAIGNGRYMKIVSLNIGLFTCIFMLFIFPCTGQAIVKDKNAQGVKSVEKIVDALVQPLIDSAQIAGTAVGIMRNDSILLLKSYGYADLEFEVPLPVDASFELGSITKQFTAVAIMQLVEKGQIKLDDPINKHLTFDAKADTITIRQLLNHTSGIKEVPLRNFIQEKYPRDTILRLLEKQQLDFKPGTQMMYSNTGYKILGLLIEKVTKQSYEEYIVRNIFEKAGMTKSYLADLETIRKLRAHGYNNINKDGELTRAEQPYFYWTFSAGALSSTVEDLFKWNQALHTSEKVLKKETYRQLITPGIVGDNILLRYGMGIQVYKYQGHPIIGHGGSGSGILSDLHYFPDQKLTVIVLQNTYRRIPDSQISYAIADQLLPQLKKRTERPPNNLSIYKGTYKGLLEIKVDVFGSELIAKKSWQTKGDTLMYIGNEKWSLGTDHYSFTKENGKIKEMRLDLIYANIILKKE